VVPTEKKERVGGFPLTHRFPKGSLQMNGEFVLFGT
jgi:hypothetical protein